MAEKEKIIKPYSEVKVQLAGASPAWEKLTGHIRYYYEMDEVWWAGNPNGKHHSNLYFRKGGKSFFTLCVRDGFFIAGVVFGKDEREKFETMRGEFSEAITKEYDSQESLHDGKWLGWDIYDESLIDDIIKLLPIKRKPNRKVLPTNKTIQECGQLDLGLSHQEITNQIS